MGTLLRAFLVALAAVATPAAASAGDNQALWAELPPPELAAADGLAASDSFTFSVGLEPSFDARDDGTTDAVNASASAAGAYHIHREYESHAFEGRAENGRLALSLASDNTTGSRANTFTGTFDVTALEFEWRQYLLPDVAGLGLPLFVAGTAGLYRANVTGVTGTDTTYSLPLSAAASVGLGRILPVAPRIALARIHEMLINDGVIAGPIPDELADAIVRTWKAYANELGSEQRLLFLMKQLNDAGLVVRPLTPSSAYRLERLVTELVDGTLVDRRIGSDTRLSFRVHQTVTSTDQPFRFTIELRDRHVFNLTLDTDLWFEPALGIGPRADDYTANTLPGHRRVGLLSASLTSLPGEVSTAAIPTGMVVLDLPVNYTQLFYDDFYNTSGLLTLHTGVTAGYTPDEPFDAVVTLGGAYTMFSSATTGYRLGLLAGVGSLKGEFAASVQVIASIVGGTGVDVYVAPDTVGDAVPFDTSWLPHE